MRTTPLVCCLSLLFSLAANAQSCIPPAQEIDRGPRPIHYYDENLCKVCKAIIDNYPWDLLPGLHLPRDCRACEAVIEPLDEESLLDSWKWSNYEIIIGDETHIRSDTESLPGPVPAIVHRWNEAFLAVGDPAIAWRRSSSDKWQVLNNLSYMNQEFADYTGCHAEWDPSVARIALESEFGDDQWAPQSLDKALYFFRHSKVIVLDLSWYQRGSITTIAEISGRFLNQSSDSLTIRKRIAGTATSEEKAIVATPHAPNFEGRLVVVTKRRWPSYAIQHFLAKRPNTIFIEDQRENLQPAVDPKRIVISDSLEILIPTTEIISFVADSNLFAGRRYEIGERNLSSSSDLDNFINNLIDSKRPTFDEVAATDADTTQWPWTFHAREFPRSDSPKY